MGITDEKNLVVILGIMSLFIMVTLNETIGAVYFGMVALYAIVLNQGSGRVYEFMKGTSGIGKVIYYGVILSVITIAIVAMFAGSQDAYIKSVTTFASSFDVNFSIDNPLIKLFVFGFFIPVVESLAFFGVGMKMLERRVRSTGSIRSMNTWVVIAMTAGIATAFHFLVRMLSDTGLMTDLIFFGTSAFIVNQQKDLTGATLAHIAFNTIAMASILGMVTI